MCHFSTASPWLSSDNYGITTRVKLKPSTVSKIERDSQLLWVLKSHFAGSEGILCQLSFASERRKSKSVQRENVVDVFSQYL